ncbi:hypothetical protein FRC03_000456 [Tulasnella sp. 419]|nr:hypothetical protein FRC03_000456 [Tulasnella sp. 419]
MQEFQVASKVDSCLKNVERHDQLLKGQTELKGGQVDLKNQIQDNQAELIEGQKQILDAVKDKVVPNLSSRRVETAPSSI